jgi:putative hydrolase of the HAD superfamily
MKYEAVLLDVGGVFHLPNHDRIVAIGDELGHAIDRDLIDRAHYAAVAGVMPERATNAPDHVGEDTAFWVGYFGIYLGTLGVPTTSFDDARALFNQAYQAGGLFSRIVPGSVDGLRALAATGVRLGIISNANGSVEARLAAEAVCQIGDGPGVAVEIIIDSGILGIEKPDPRIFEHALHQLNLHPGQVLYVGDTPLADAVGARNAGIRPILIDPYGYASQADEATTVKSLQEVVALLH